MATSPLLEYHDGFTAIMWASMHNVVVVELLLHAGADKGAASKVSANLKALLRWRLLKLLFCQSTFMCILLVLHYVLSRLQLVVLLLLYLLPQSSSTAYDLAKRWGQTSIAALLEK